MCRYTFRYLKITYFRSRWKGVKEPEFSPLWTLDVFPCQYVQLSAILLLQACVSAINQMTARIKPVLFEEPNQVL